MRPIYLLLKLTLAYSFALFYRKRANQNAPKSFFGRTIFVSNHPNSFMDPIIIGSISRPVVHFMTRSDVFKWWLQPVLWSSHMLPIFRQHDGGNTQRKNGKVFNKVNKALKLGRNILIFGEGFTDDTPIYGLKPIKKGAVRMGFTALEYCNWQKKIYIQAMGVNYSDRNTIGSDVIIDYQDKICLNDYQKSFAENPNKVITDLTKELEKQMQNSVIFLDDHKETNFFRNLMGLEENSFHPTLFNPALTLSDRYNKAKLLAEKFNEILTNDDFLEFKKEAESYFSLIKRMNLSDDFVAQASRGKLSRNAELMKMIALFPFALIGWITCFIPYLSAKYITQKIMKRKVFWGSVKMMLAKLIGLIVLLPLSIFLFRYFDLSGWFGLLTFVFLPLFWRLSYEFQKVFVRFQTIGKIMKIDLTKFIKRRTELKENMNRFFQV